MFEFLFKFRLEVFKQGALQLVHDDLSLLAALALLAVGVVLAWRSSRRGGGLKWPLLIGRLITILVATWWILRPALVLSSVVPQENFLAVVYDHSTSMSIHDADGDISRLDWVKQQLRDGTALRTRLANRFRLREFAFGDRLERVQGLESLVADGHRSMIGGALSRTATELSAVPLAGIVLLTDGAANAGEDIEHSLVELKAKGIAVYPVVVGEDRFQRDLELRAVEVPRRVLRGTAAEATVTLAQVGLGNRRVFVEVSDAGDANRILHRQEVLLVPGRAEQVEQLFFNLPEAGARTLRFQVTEGNDEAVKQNNVRWAVVEVEDRPQKVLYLEGEPRFEYKFLRRAAEEDEDVQLVAMVRLAENRFYRQEVDSGEELAEGFPSRREDLFAYRGLIIGSVAAHFFSYDQMRMVLDFASRRGGGVLFLGGSGSFGEGGYAGTPLAELMPVLLPAEVEGQEFFAALRMKPALAAAAFPLLQLPPSSDGAPTLWEGLPSLSSVNRVVATKPGATALLTGTGDGFDGEQIVLAHHRYGLGKAMVFSVQDSWLWQMQLPSTDRTHEVFWRQLLRWLVDGVPDAVEAWSPRGVVEPGDRIEIFARVRDAQFLDINRATVTARVTANGGDVVEVPLVWTVAQDGLFRGEVDLATPGLANFEVEATSGGEIVGIGSFDVAVADQNSEMFHAAADPGFLRRVAEETGGRLYGPKEIGNLVEDLSFSQKGVSIRESHDLWNMPATFLLFVGLVCAEWLLRRRGGLA